ncbi:hypothetical protein H6G06_07340 [Anabaena sphaerica FACHB-251]|uniref:Uncharacterized protein n=1 Tax=Anabaena sphaerica FACHB-251 TaxID=2692883 RepID=A0A926WFS9_9NOST|nr:hypothetical protein [Anabaena sphaerica]MBD2293305.1 hypothetical protein [Anabaena sphaerica FACHB-251]
MKRITSFFIATVIASMSVLGITQNADAHPHYRRQTTTHVRRYRTCTGRNRYRYYHGRYYRCRYSRQNTRHH